MLPSKRQRRPLLRFQLESDYAQVLQIQALKSGTATFALYIVLWGDRIWRAQRIAN